MCQVLLGADNAELKEKDKTPCHRGRSEELAMCVSRGKTLLQTRGTEGCFLPYRWLPTQSLHLILRKRVGGEKPTLIAWRRKTTYLCFSNPVITLFYLIFSYIWEFQYFKMKYHSILSIKGWLKAFSRYYDKQYFFPMSLLNIVEREY